MFAPHHLPFLIKYFDGIDAFVARKMSRPAPPGETTLTEEFCAMMDAGNQRAEGLLSYDLDALNADLSSNGYVIDADFQIQVHPHARGDAALDDAGAIGPIFENEICPITARVSLSNQRPDNPIRTLCPMTDAKASSEMAGLPLRMIDLLNLGRALDL